MAVITISRQQGSGGHDIARAAAELLDARYVDRVLVTGAARRIGVPTDIVSDRDERIQGLTERLLESITLAFSALRRRKSPVLPGEGVILTDAQMLEVTRALIRQAARDHKAVIVGRGGQMVLRGEPGALHVHVVAPLEERVQRIAVRDGISAEEAERKIAKVDAERANYMRTFYLVDWEDPTLYHLVLNTGLLGLEIAVQIVVLAAALLDEGHHPSAERRGHGAIEGLLASLQTVRGAGRAALERLHRED